MRSWVWMISAAACSAPAAGDDAAVVHDAALVDAVTADAAVDAPRPVCAPAPGAGVQQVTCPDGVVFAVAAPASCPASGCGLILDQHGLTMTGDQEDRHTRMRALGTAAGYVVVQGTSPAALHAWSSGDYDASTWAFVRATRDVFAVDPDRVHVMGFSQGSQMTLRLVCAYADEIASAAPTAARGCFDGAVPSVPVPLLYTHGLLDSVVAFSVTAPGLRDDIVDAYALDAGTPFVDAAGHDAIAYRDGAGVVRLEYWTHGYTAPPLGGVIPVGGHCLPGPLSTEDYRCRDAGQYDHSVEVLRFFAAHPRASGAGSP